MADNVERLKELLFDSEAERIRELKTRVDALGDTLRHEHAELLERYERLSAADQVLRAELNSRLEALDRDARDSARFEARVSSVLDGALKQAESDRYDAVSDAMSPFVVETVRTEIRNNQDTLVEALYPVTGRIVRAYVASAIKDLAEQINRRLETNPLMLRLRSLMTGRPVAELAIADSQRLEVEELFLVRRGSGELIGRWPDREGGANRDQVLSGVLAAINNFASEALSDGDGDLRHVDLGQSRVYLRSSPQHLLAVRCSGSAPVAVEAVIDENLLKTIEALTAGGAGQSHDARSVLMELAPGLATAIRTAQDEINGRSPGMSPLRALAWLIGLPLIAWIAWSLYSDWRVGRVREAAGQIISASPEIKGYPAHVSVGWLGQSIVVSGLAPTQSARETVAGRLRAGLPGVAVDDEFSVIPDVLAHVEPVLGELKTQQEAIAPEVGRVGIKIDALEGRLERAEQFAVVNRALRRLSSAVAELKSIGNWRTSAEARRGPEIVLSLDRASSLLEEARAAMMHGDTNRQQLLNDKLSEAAQQVRAANRQLAGLLAENPAAAEVPLPSSAAALSETVEAETERVLINAVAVRQLEAFAASLPPPPQPVVVTEAPAPTPRARLEAWTAANAIFFSADAEYRDASFAGRQFDELATLLKETGLLVRVIGYTDQLGGQDRNSPLSRSRADKVAGELRSRGVPDRQLAVVGRIESRDISSYEGPASPNRRVEFEVGFEGEPQP